MRLIFSLLVAIAVSGPAAAGPFDDLSDADRDALGAQIRSYLLENPEVLVEVISVLEARQAEAAAAAEADMIAANREAIFEDGVSRVAGNPDGDVTIVEFLDYQCSFCKRAHPEVAELLSSDGNIRLIQKEFPILGPASEDAARAAIAVLLEDGGEIYDAFADRLMRHEGPLNAAVIAAYARESGADLEAMQARANTEEVTTIIARNRALGSALGISGTPTFIVGEEMVRGYVPLSQMQTLVTRQRGEM